MCIGEPFARLEGLFVLATLAQNWRLERLNETTVGIGNGTVLNPDQPMFSYGSHDLSLIEADALIRRVRAKHPVQMPELKASKLLKTPRGRALIGDVLDEVVLGLVWMDAKGLGRQNGGAPMPRAAISEHSTPPGSTQSKASRSGPRTA